MNTICSYTSKSALRIIGLVLDALAAGPASTLEIITSVGMSRQHVITFIKHLESVGRIACVAPAVGGFGAGAMPAMWALNLPADEAAAIDEQVDSFPRRVIVRNSGDWTPNHIRCPLECLLFGVPSAMQAAA